MSSPQSLIYGIHVNSPTFKLKDSQLRFSIDKPHKSKSETVSTTLSPLKRGSFASSTSSGFPSLNQDLVNSVISPRTENASVLSKQATVPISHLYASPRPHLRHLSDIPNISIRDIETETHKRLIEKTTKQKQLEEPKIIESFKDSLAINTRQNSMSITSLHANENHVDIEYYLKYLNENTSPNLRKDLEEKIYGKLPVNRNSSNVQDSNLSYKLIRLPSIPQLSKSGSIGSKSPLNLDKSRFSRKASFDSLTPMSPHVDLVIENNQQRNTTKTVANTKLKPIPLKTRDEESPDSSPHDGQGTPYRTSAKLTHSHTRRAGFLQEINWHNQYSELFIDVAHNLRSLYQLISNEAKIHQIIDKLAENNSAVVNLTSAKCHKIFDYDFEKLQRKYSLIEVTSESFSIPEKLEKQRVGISTIEPIVIRDLGYFNAKLDDFILKKKQENLKLVELRLITSENKLWEIQQKKLNELKEKGRVKEYNYAEKILAQKPRIDPFYFFQCDPVTAIESYQNNNGELKYVKKKNLEHGKSIAQVFNHWIEHVNSS